MEPTPPPWRGAYGARLSRRRVSTYDRVIDHPGNEIPVPEGGSTLAILDLGLLGLAGLRRRLR
jgi:hypothetical protein